MKKYELMIVIAGSNWIYFATDKDNEHDALNEFVEKCEMVGINIDNVTIAETELRAAK